jgi:hypothetical protein
MADGPDFLCIGQQKAGTTWLFDQLCRHPAFWMPTTKELHFFDGRLDRHKDKRAKTPFMEELKKLIGANPTIEDYASLFRFKKGKIAGDLTPTYTGIADEQIAAIARRFPEIRIVLLVRDPIERAWSQINMMDREGRFDHARMEHANRFRKFLRRPSLEGRSFPTKIRAAWLAHISAERFMTVLFDDVVASPVETRDAIVTFLGAQPTSLAIAPDYNTQGDHAPKLVMNNIVLSAMREHFGDEITACGAVFGGAAAGWASRYGL